MRHTATQNGQATTMDHCFIASLAMTSAQSLDEQIAQEELLIRCYEAELKRLQQTQTRENNADADNDVTAPADDNHHHLDKDVLLEWMIRDNAEAADDIASNVDLDPARLIRENHLQAVLSGFCVESVDRWTKRIDLAATKEGSQKTQEYSRGEKYHLRGYFMDNPSLGAEIDMELLAMDNRDSSLDQSSDLPEQSHTQAEHGLRMTSLQVRFAIRHAAALRGSRLPAIDVTWLQQQVASAMVFDPLNLAHWMDRTKRYLRFLKRRQAFLETHHESITVTEQVHSKLTMEVDLMTAVDKKELTSESTDTNNKAILRLCWDWSWKHEKDLLRLSERAPASLTLHRSGLANLVKVAGSCQAAIELILDNNDKESRPHQADTNDSDSEHRKYSSEDDLSYKHSGDDGDDDSSRSSSSSEEPVYQPSEYELQRLERMKRNEEYFASLGLQRMSEVAKQNESNKRHKTK